MEAESDSRDFPIVCVGGSAGGLDAYTRLLRASRGAMDKVAEDREKTPEAGRKGSQRTQGGHQETQPSQSSEVGR
jgi:general stress protein YciG